MDNNFFETFTFPAVHILRKLISLRTKQLMTNNKWKHHLLFVICCLVLRKMSGDLISDVWSLHLLFVICCLVPRKIYQDFICCVSFVVWFQKYACSFYLRCLVSILYLSFVVWFSERCLEFPFKMFEGFHLLFVICCLVLRNMSGVSIYNVWSFHL